MSLPFDIGFFGVSLFSKDASNAAGPYLSVRYLAVNAYHRRVRETNENSADYLVKILPQMFIPGLVNAWQMFIPGLVNAWRDNQ